MTNTNDKALNESGKSVERMAWESKFLNADHKNEVKGYIILSQFETEVMIEIQDDFTTFGDIYDLVSGLSDFAIRYSDKPDHGIGTVCYEIGSHGLLKFLDRLVDSSD